MTIQVPPNGSRGAWTPPGGLLRTGSVVLAGLYHLSGGRLGHTMLITTVGAKSGHGRTASIRRFDDGEGRWLVAGTAGGSAHHPAWVYNLARNPDKVSVDIGRERLRVKPELLTGDARTEAWQRIVSEARGFAKYAVKTDREIPVIPLTRAA